MFECPYARHRPLTQRESAGLFYFTRLKQINMEATFQLTPETLVKAGPFWTVNKSVTRKYGVIQAAVLAELVFVRHTAQKTKKCKEGWFKVTDKHMDKELVLSSYKTNKSLAEWQALGIIETQVRFDGSRWVYLHDDIAGEVLGVGVYRLKGEDMDEVMIWPPKVDEKNLDPNPKNLETESKKFGNHLIYKKVEEREPENIYTASELYEVTKKSFDDSGGKKGFSYIFFKALAELDANYIWQAHDGKALNECVWMAKKRIQKARKDRGHPNPFGTDREAYIKLADMVRNLPDFYMDKFDTALLAKKFNEFAKTVTK